MQISNAMKVSIIIPCYNSSSYIFRCISNLFAQTYTKWEAIFVNDGSIDDTLNRLQNCSGKDERIKIFSQPNQGAAKARELGISKATGDYITFLDVDDTLSADALEKMVNAFDEKNVDIVVSGFNIVKRNKIVKRKTLQRGELDNLTYLKRVLSGKYGWELWAKMYRRELFLQPIKTPEGIRIGEDASVFIQLVIYAKRIRILSEQLYNYIQYSESASHTKSSKYAEETLQAAFFIEKILKETLFYDEIKGEIDAMFLLFYSNSTRKMRLNSNHPLVRNIIVTHGNISAMRRIPLLKVIYICISFGLSFIQCHKL